MNLLKIPFAINTDGKPSITLLFSVITFVIAVLSVIALHFFNCSVATFYSIVFWAIATAFYKMKNIDKLSISQNSIEIDDEPDANPPAST